MIIHQDILTVASNFEAGKYQAIITSPPYWGHRNYSDDDREIGCERSSDEYMDNILRAISQLKPSLSPSGVLWVNIGDKYISGDLQGIPWRFAILMSDRLGWILRQEIIWNKTRCKPETVKDRCTLSHEHIFMFTRSLNYYFNTSAIREENSPTSKTGGKFNKPQKYGEFVTGSVVPRNGRNKRSVWSIATCRSTKDHPAPFPSELARTCILASTRPGDHVLDPFCGSGTVCIEAKKLGRLYTGVDIHKPNVDFVNEQLRHTKREMPINATFK